MPRKVAKTEKPALLFLERPGRGARLQNVPAIRAAVNPKEFFTETQIHHGSSLNSWVCSLFLQKMCKDAVGYHYVCVHQ